MRLTATIVCVMIEIVDSEEDRYDAEDDDPQHGHYLVAGPVGGEARVDGVEDGGELANVEGHQHQSWGRG